MPSSSNLFVPALIFAAVGFLAGILIMTLVGDRRRRKEDAEKSSPVMEDLIVPEMPALPENRFESVANLYRETRTGRLVADVKGKVFLNRGSIPEEQLHSLQEAARNWATWLGISPVEAPQPAAAPFESVPVAPVPSPAPAEPAVEPTPVPFMTETIETAGETVAEEALQLEEIAVPEELPVEMVAPEEPPSEVAAPEEPDTTVDTASAAEPPATQILPPTPPSPVTRAAPAEKPRGRSMVGQIDDILQEMLPDTIYSELNIHLTEEFKNGVVVWIGANKFVGIESVPDPDIKALIQSAVRQWEANESER